MQALFPTDTHALTFTRPLPAKAMSDQLLDANELQTLGERLRVAYGPVEETLPARLAELVERLARHEVSEGNVRD